MNSTYLELTNKLLLRLNEVRLNESNFDDLSVRGIHAAAKVAIQDAVLEISQSEQEWPFNAYQHTQNLLPGVNEYVWPDGFRVADWSSFIILKDDDLNTQSRHLGKINRDDWYRTHRAMDIDSEASGREMPYFVFDTHGIGFGVTPRPDKAYPISFRYYKDPNALTEHDDTTLIPKQFDHVIINKALIDMYLFLDNSERASLMESRYNRALAIMRTVLINKPQFITDRRVRG